MSAAFGMSVIIICDAAASYEIMVLDCLMKSIFYSGNKNLKPANAAGVVA
jgi:hypothetical protein